MCRWRRGPAAAARRSAALPRRQSHRRRRGAGGRRAAWGTFYGKRYVVPSRIVFDLVTAGEAFDDFIFYGLDRLPANGEELKTQAFSRSPGGGAIITAIAAARLGLRAAVVSAVSNDGAGMLRAERVSVRNLRRR